MVSDFNKVNIMTQYSILIFSIVIASVVVAYSVREIFKNLAVRQTVFEYQRALLYRDGKFIKTLEPGSYWLWKFNTSVTKMDIRPTFLTLPGQELVTVDNMSIKVSLSVNYRIVDPYAAVQMTDSFSAALYTVAQLELRQLIAPMTIDQLMVARPAISEGLQKAIANRAAEFGVEVISADIKDIMLPGEIKKIMTQVVKAQKEAQAALEKTRGETAALRSLANAARMLEASPALMQLRLLQSIGETSGNTIVYGVSANGVAAGVASKPEDA
jgi:regulator of protease activity HflC (stomatin/prohibitin superfamily)